MKVQIDHDVHEVSRTVIEDGDLTYLIERSDMLDGGMFLTVIVFRAGKPIDSHSHQVNVSKHKTFTMTPDVFAYAMCPTCLRKFRIAVPLRDVVETPRCCDLELVLVCPS